VKEKYLQLEGKVKAVFHIGERAAGTIDDFIHGRQGALWMTSSMDATEGGKQSVLVLVTWSSSKAKSKLWAHANEKNQRIEIDKNNSMNHGNIRLAHCQCLRHVTVLSDCLCPYLIQKLLMNGS
jgi:hypothetical protein